MAVEVTPRALEVLRRALDVGRMDPGRVAVRLSLATGLRGEELRTGFADAPDPDETVLDANGIRLYLPASLVERDAVIDVANEHDRIIIR